ncbi:MAG: acyl-ACP desaturase [Candidatus Thermofonsia Clade 1 bacterium]|uniref:Acyl-ACP desaturase n=1 Tax=Candidatus Thermofonsia Clade 1 bacterium TaxID=2364210 RepID=A0A2M8PBG1_9CHLR|nr:MAG: acyl-ACP desaturase [Candidatus Thermofonsia Clade 1 bacterium]
MAIAQLIPSLEPRLRELFNQHTERARNIDWAYSDYIPLDEFQRDPQAIPRLSPTILSAIELAVFTEVNLPWFTTALHAIFKGSWSVLLDFVHTWTSEEDAHSLLLETYLFVGRNGDPRARAALRKQVIRAGLMSADLLYDPLQALVYTAIQERATQIYYLNVAQAAEREDPHLARLLRRLAKDETLHYTFYRDAVKLHLEADPNCVYPVADVLLKFEMPGRGSPGYQERADRVRMANIYGPEQFYAQVIDVVLKYWRIAELHPTYAEAREAQQKIVKQHARLAKIAAQLAARRERQAQQQGAQPE